jgi:hypothetical protein
LANNSNNYDYDQALSRPLVDAVVTRLSDEMIWNAVYEAIPPCRILSSSLASGFANAAEHSKRVEVPSRTNGTVLDVGTASRTKTC